jgi:hypothetical protein
MKQSSNLLSPTRYHWEHNMSLDWELELIQKHLAVEQEAKAILWSFIGNLTVILHPNFFSTS